MLFFFGITLACRASWPELSASVGSVLNDGEKAEKLIKLIRHRSSISIQGSEFYRVSINRDASKDGGMFKCQFSMSFYRYSDWHEDVLDKRVDHWQQILRRGASTTIREHQETVNFSAVIHDFGLAEVKCSETRMRREQGTRVMIVYNYVEIQIPYVQHNNLKKIIDAYFAHLDMKEDIRVYTE